MKVHDAHVQREAKHNGSHHGWCFVMDPNTAKPLAKAFSKPGVEPCAPQSLLSLLGAPRIVCAMLSSAVTKNQQ